MNWYDATEGMAGKPLHLMSAFVQDGNWLGIQSIPDIPPPDELVWTINGFWRFVPRCDLGFEMHDLGGPSYEAMEDPDWYYKNCLLLAECPVFMPSPAPQFPMVVEYPLDEVMRFWGLKQPYFGESPNFCLALAGMLEVPKVTMYGFGYPTGYQKQGERASTEFWCGMLKSRGVEIEVVLDGYENTSMILECDEWEDFYEPQLYGYRRRS